MLEMTSGKIADQSKGSGSMGDIELKAPRPQREALGLSRNIFSTNKFLRVPKRGRGLSWHSPMCCWAVILECVPQMKEAG